MNRPDSRDPDGLLTHLRQEEERARRSRVRSALGAWWLGAGTPGRASWKSYGGMSVVVAGCTAIAALMERHFELSNLTMVYLLGVVVSAIAFGRGPAIWAAILSVATFDVAFVPPRWTFRVEDAQYLVTFGVMLVVAVATGTLTAQLRGQVQKARLRERRTAALYRLSHDMAARSTASEVLEAAAASIAEVLETQVAILLASETGNLEVRAGDPLLVNEGREAMSACRAYENAQPVGLNPPGEPEARLLHMPLLVGAQSLGVVSLLRRDADTLRDPDRWELLRVLVRQTALALERARLAEDADRARMLAETERTRSALLSSVSHDLRTPLAAITGAASGLVADTGSMPETTRRELAEAISEEAQRLNRLIGNLLDMTRLESGALRVRKDWHSLEEVVGAALVRLEPTLGDRPVEVTIPSDLPLVPLDDVLFEQVLCNLIENAHKYAPAERPIEVSASIDGTELRLDVADGGPGLEPGETHRVFEKFYRGTRGMDRPGVGLGLAICQGIVVAHGGTIEAGNRPRGGAVLTIRLPIEGDPPILTAEPLESSQAGNAR
jgi:two-component system sensor histidine kinase KdpD